MRVTVGYALLCVGMVGCGGSSFAVPDAGEDGPSVGPDAAQDAAPDVAPTDAAVDRASDAPSSTHDAGADDAGDAHATGDACTPVTYYLDADNDAYGGAMSVTSCFPPPSGTWVTVGGDCDDSNGQVHPGQLGYFDVGYLPPGQTQKSFDYNCDGKETESGNSPRASCAVVSLACTGSGYVEATPARSGMGVDPFCGSTSAVTCAFASLNCQAGAPYMTSAITCR